MILLSMLIGYIAAPPIDPCQDAIADCARYGTASCTGQYTDWAKINCQRFCQFCNRKILKTYSIISHRLRYSVFNKTH